MEHVDSIENDGIFIRVFSPGTNPVKVSTGDNVIPAAKEHFFPVVLSRRTAESRGPLVQGWNAAECRSRERERSGGSRRRYDLAHIGARQSVLGLPPGASRLRH